MYCFQKDIAFQEVPNEVSLILSISGCPARCVGCHSIDLWKDKNGVFLSEELFLSYLKMYEGLLTCVCFFGGEWQKEQLIKLLRIARSHNLKTCLYSGEKGIPEDIEMHLTYLKLGPWIESLGGLESIHTNQRIMNLETGEVLNHYFWKTPHGGRDVEAYTGANQ